MCTLLERIEGDLTFVYSSRYWTARCFPTRVYKSRTTTCTTQTLAETSTTTTAARSSPPAVSQIWDASPSWHVVLSPSCTYLRCLPRYRLRLANPSPSSGAYPMISHFTKKEQTTLGGFNLGGTNATGQVRVINASGICGPIPTLFPGAQDAR